MFRKHWLPANRRQTSMLMAERVKSGQGPRTRAARTAASESPVSALVARMNDGDQQAWHELIERYSPLIWAICQRYQLTGQDIDDVSQSVWLLLVENIASFRDAVALPGWLSTTTRHEIFRVLRVARRHDHDDLPPDEQMPLDPESTTIEQEYILAKEKAALRAAFVELPPSCHDLLSLLISDPPLSYADISTILECPVGSIGPKRARCLERLRRSPLLAGIVEQVAPAGRGQKDGGVERGVQRMERRNNPGCAESGTSLITFTASGAPGWRPQVNAGA